MEGCGRMDAADEVSEEGSQDFGRSSPSSNESAGEAGGISTGLTLTLTNSVLMHLILLLPYSLMDFLWRSRGCMLKIVCLKEGIGP